MDFKPCPFCGGASGYHAMLWSTSVAVRCGDCGAVGPPVLVHSIQQDGDWHGKLKHACKALWDSRAGNAARKGEGE